MNHEQLAKVIINNIMPAGRKPMLWGPPGVGKTDLVTQIAGTLAKATGKPWDLRVWDMTHLYDPADARGIPTIKTMPDGRRVTEFLTPEHMVIDGKPTIVLLDDLPTLPQSSQAACYRLLQHGEIGGTKFGPNVFFMGAGNRMGDNSATNSMPFALANRFTHLRTSLDPDGWVQWALANGMPIELIAFHRFTKGENLYPIFNDEEGQKDCPLCKNKIQPDAICSACVKRSRALPTPRSWSEGVGRLLPTKPDSDVELELYAGEVGKEKAAEALGYFRTFRQIPSPDSIIMGPNTAPVPSEVSAMYFVATYLGRSASVTNIDAVVQYLERLPNQEFGAITIKDAIRRTPDVEHTRAVMTWKTKHQELWS